MCRLSVPLTTFAATIGFPRLSQPLREENPPGRRDCHDFRAHYRAFRFPASGHGANWLRNGRFPVAGFWCDHGRFGVSIWAICAHGLRWICPYEGLQCPKNGRKNAGCVSSAKGVKTGRKTPLKRARTGRVYARRGRCVGVGVLHILNTNGPAIVARPWRW